MDTRHFIGMDVHTQTTDIAVVTGSGRVTQRHHCGTNIPELANFLDRIRRPRHVVIEEGPMADWLLRNLQSHCEEFTICDPRRNHLVAKESDKDDPIDAEKLAQLRRGGYIKAVHHPASLDRMIFKRHVGLYHDGVRQRVRQGHRIMAELRCYGLVVRASAFGEVAGTDGRRDLLDHLPRNATLRADMDTLWTGYDALVGQVREMANRLIGLSKKEPQIKRFTALPGIHWIRAATFFAYIDTPWRFRSKSALCKYMGIGLERRRSGADPKRWSLRIPRSAHRCLKNMILGAALSAVASRSNPFADQYERWHHAGLTPRIARRNVARSQAAAMWGMWKNGDVYRPELVGADIET